METYHVSKEALDQIGQELTQQERDFVAAIQSGLNKMDRDVAEVLHRLNIKPARALDEYSPLSAISGHAAGGESLSASRSWPKKGRSRSVAYAFAKERDRIAGNASEDNPDSILEAILCSLVWAVADPQYKPGRSLMRKQRKSESEIIPPDRNDAYLFELGSYFLFVLDIWHINNAPANARSEILYRKVILPFILLFEQSLGAAHLCGVLLNRFQLYHSIFRESEGRYSDRMRFFFVELAKRCDPRGAPIVYDFSSKFPIVLTGIMEEFGIAVDWSSKTVGMLEPICNMFTFLYGQTHK